jgi:hypothetical protein
MKTIDVIRTIKWIEGQVGKATKEFLLSRKLFRPDLLERQANDEKIGPRVELIMKIVGEVAVAGQVMLTHPFALKVLTSFKIEQLFNSDFVSKRLSMLIDKREAQAGAIPGDIWEMISRWDEMTSCVRPIQELTIPSEVVGESDYDETLTIQIVRSDEVSSTLETLQTVIEDINKLYEIFATLGTKVAVEPLRVIYIASGSSIRIDVKGLGEPIKHIKNLLVEGWSLWRHRKATELTENSRALLSSLKTFGEIEKQVKSGAMKRHEADTLKARIQKTMLSLYGEGALPREIPTVESVPNHTLIELKPQKLLSAPSSVMLDESEVAEAPITVEEISPAEPVVKAKAKVVKGKKVSKKK